MKNILFSVLGVTALSLTACAGGNHQEASMLSVTERVTVQAPASAVWQRVNNFGDLGAWHPAVAKTDIVNGSNNQAGAVRKLTLQDGGTITETLTAYDANAMTYAYVINEGVLPVSNYRSTITVTPAGNASEVVWEGAFKRKDVSANPAKGQDDKTATDTVHAVYKTGLANLKKISE